MLYIGIDPGKSTGLATWDSQKEELNIWPALSFWKAVNAVREIVSRETPVTLVIEDAGGNRPVFHRGKMGRQNLKIAQNVGSNKRDSQLWISLCEHEDWRYETFIPKRSKWSKDYFRRVTGYAGRVSQHGIDAATSIYGR